MTDSPAASAPAPSLKGEVVVVEPDRFERAIARRSAEIRATVPSVDYQTVVQIDAAIQLAARLGCDLSAVVISAVAMALRSHSRVNAAYRDGHYELFSRANIGVTLIEHGLYTTPTIFDADEKGAMAIGRELDSYRERARVTELHPSELAGATFTILDVSGAQVTAVSPLITPPQAAALAICPVRAAALVRDGEVQAGHLLTLTLAADHRILFGATPLAFLDEVKSTLEHAGDDPA